MGLQYAPTTSHNSNSGRCVPHTHTHTHTGMGLQYAPTTSHNSNSGRCVPHRHTHTHTLGWDYSMHQQPATTVTPVGVYHTDTHTHTHTHTGMGLQYAPTTSHNSNSGRCVPHTHTHTLGWDYSMHQQPATTVTQVGVYHTDRHTHTHWDGITACTNNQPQQ